MKRNFALAAGILSALAASPVFANPESAATRQGPAAQASTQDKPASSAEHVVSPGDSLAKIARIHGCRVSDLMSSNDLKEVSIIRPGQKLKLPAQDRTSPAVVAPLPAQSAAATHTVAAGETFAAIARQHGIPLNELLAANPEIKPTALRPGQSVKLGQATPALRPTLDAGSTQMILAAKENSSVSEPPLTPAPLASPPTVKIQQIKIDREMTYHEFASRQGTNTRRLNQLNGLDLLDSALLAKGSELLAPAQP